MPVGESRFAGQEDVSLYWERKILVVMAVGAVLLAACRPQPERETLLVFAAASLADVMTELEQQFEAAYPGVDLLVNLGASSLLARQIERGAPADVFLSASPAWTAFLGEREQLRAPAQSLVGNRLVVIGQCDAAPLAGPR